LNGWREQACLAGGRLILMRMSAYWKVDMHAAHQAASQAVSIFQTAFQPARQLLYTPKQGSMVRLLAESA